VVSAYGVAHAFVDASCAALVFPASTTGKLAPAEVAAAVLAYNLLAFASQPLLGWFVTESRSAHAWARIGASMVAGAFFLSLVPGLMWPAVVLTGLGNAIFHLGGGSWLCAPRQTKRLSRGCSWLQAQRGWPLAFGFAPTNRLRGFRRCCSFWPRCLSVP